MTASAFREWLETLVECRATIEAAEVLSRLPDSNEPDLTPEPVAPPFSDLSWRERLWLVPAETRLGVAELAEALARSRSWIHHRTGPNAEDPIPHRKLDGSLVFVVGEVRHWLRSKEEPVVSCPMESTPAERALLRVVEGGR